MAKSKKSVEEVDAGELQRIRDQFDYNFRKWDPIYKEGDIDMRYRAGHPWEPAAETARKESGRLCLSFDELSQYRNQAVNDVRANPVSAKFTPDGDGANDKTAQFYEDLHRETDYRSTAQIAYTTAFENAIDRSFGFTRVKLEYLHPKSFLQHVTIEAVPNPACCFPDADAVRPDGRDWMNFDFIEAYTRAEFKRLFPKAQYKDFSTEQINAVKGGAWGSEDSVQVSEHWDVEMREGMVIEYEVPPTLLNPQPRIIQVLKGKDRKPRNGRETQRRVTEYPVVRSCLTNGLEILEKNGAKWHPFVGDSIPFAPCYGAILWRNQGSGAEREVLSMIRLARMPYMAYCYAITSLVEAVGMITKNPYFAYEGMLDTEQMNAIAKSLHEPVSVLLSKPFLKERPDLGILPMLQRNPLAIDISSYLGLAEICRRAIQAAMGWTPLPTQAQKQNEKSGVALQKIEESGQRGSFHFKDNYYGMLRRVAEIEENIYDRIYDTPRDVVVRGRDNETRTMRINEKPKQGARPDDKVLPSIKGRHTVTIDIGPEYDSEREAADAMVDNLIGSPIMQMIEPGARNKVIALSIKARNIGPMGDKIADTISPPEQEDGQGPPPEVLKAKLQEGAQMIQQMQQRIQELETGIVPKKMEVESREKIAMADIQSRENLENMKADQNMAKAELDNETRIQIQRMKDHIDRMELEVKALQQRNEHAHELGMAEHGHAAALEAGAVADARGMEAGEVEHQRGLEAGETAHEQAMESQTQSETAAERQARLSAAAKKKAGAE